MTYNLDEVDTKEVTHALLISSYIHSTLEAYVRGVGVRRESSSITKYFTNTSKEE